MKQLYFDNCLTYIHKGDYESCVLFPIKGLVSLFILIFHNTCYIILLMLELLMMINDDDGIQKW